MKLITFTVPCFNSAAYMRKCIESLVVGGEDVEIVIVNDGSTDDTLSIAREYEAAYPSLVRVVDKENGGHGSGVNAGLRLASGRFFKVVDSDDWLDEDALKTLLAIVGAHIEQGCEADLYITDFVYEKVCEGKRFRRSFRRIFPHKTFFGWDEVKKFRYSSVLMMHALLYKTDILRQCALVLPEHTFYVDNIYLYKPLPYTKRLCYLELPLYRYFIGREDQSVHEDVMIRRIDQQIRVNKLMIDAIAGKKNIGKNIRRYMLRYLEIITTVSSIMLIRSGTEENLEKKNELWKYLKSADIHIYRKLRMGILGRGVNLPGGSGRNISVAIYKLAQKFYGFN